jgi:exodeoxyribonuclease V alpha subunit
VEIWALPPRLGEAVATRAERAAGLAQRLQRVGMPRPPAPEANPVGQLDLF